MNNINRIHSFFYTVFLLHTLFASGKTWYADPEVRKDNSYDLPGAASLLPGDSIVFQGGEVYEKNLYLSYFGSDDSPVVITSIGTGKAIISAGNGYGLHFKKCNNIIISNLEFTGSGRLSGNSQNGVIIEDCRNIRISNLDISGFQHSGLLVEGTGDHIDITGVNAFENGFAGIHVFGQWPDKYKCKNIYIGHCKAYNNPGDPTVLDNHSGNGIIVGVCDSVLIEYCEATNNGWDMPRKGNGPVGIWAWHADHVIIQNCISHHNKTSQGSSDGGGFDLDGGVTNSIIQYCLSCENEGTGYGIFEYTTASPFRNNTLRYNISINDGTKNGNCSVMFWNGEGNSEMLSKVSIYNNVFYHDRTGGSAVRFVDPYFEDVLFVNNIFLTKDPAIIGATSNSAYLGNVYWNFGEPFYIDGYNSLTGWANAKGYEILGDSLVGMNLDPHMIDPGPVNLTNPDSLIYDAMSGFKLNVGSPVIDKGIDLQAVFGIDPGQRDFYSQAVPSGSGYDPGICEYQTPTSVSNIIEEFINVDPSEHSNDWIFLYPNPSCNGILYVSVSNSHKTDILWFDIRDANGKTVQSGRLRCTDEIMTINVSQSLCWNAIYLISFRDGKRVETFKFINNPRSF